jgi:AraC family transcriptional regulator of adaptative response / DNA-3-methyladenine glycosylase II
VGSTTTNAADAGPIRVAFAYRPPLAWDALLAFLTPRATPGVEVVSDGAYWRTVDLNGHRGWVRVWHDSEASPNAAVQLEASGSLHRVRMPLADRIRHLFDLDAEPAAIDAHLRAAGLPVRTRGMRVPGAFDTLELAVRAILGQQVTVKGATTLSARLARAFGEPVEECPHPALTHYTPTATQLASASTGDIRAIGLPAARAQTIAALARAIADGTLSPGPHADVQRFLAQLQAIPGIGSWTAQYIAMRALHAPDAFPASDLALRKAAGNVTERQLRGASERWRPWRAYAAMHLWQHAARGTLATW